MSAPLSELAPESSASGKAAWWRDHEQTIANRERAAAATEGLIKAMNEADLKAAAAQEQLAATESEVAAAQLAVGQAINDRADASVERENLRRLEEDAKELRWSVDARVTAAQAAEAAVDRNERICDRADARVASSLKAALAAERKACFEALLAAGGQFDVRVRDLAGEDAFRAFRMQAIANLQRR